MIDLHYFGTSLNDHGHYLWQIEGERLGRSMLDQFKLPFNLESLPYVPSITYPPNGECRFYQFAGFSILAISGSPKDHRLGSKSIFFSTRNLTFPELKAEVLSTAVGKRIIEAMPFEIRWPNDSNEVLTHDQIKAREAKKAIDSLLAKKQP